jgi:hypothetical protein
MSNMETIIPTALDVIMSRGSNSRRTEIHSGNENLFLRLVEMQRPAYLSVERDRVKKQRIIEWVINRVVDAGGRFIMATPLQQGSDTIEMYRVVSSRQVEQKVAQALREEQPEELTSAPRKKCVAPKQKRTRVVNVDVVEPDPLEQRQKVEATPIDAYLDEAIGILDDDPDDYHASRSPFQGGVSFHHQLQLLTWTNSNAALWATKRKYTRPIPK